MLNVALSLHCLMFGTSVRSEIPLPSGIAGREPADVVIACGHVPETLESPLAEGVCFQARGNALVLNVLKIARYFVEDGARITIERAPRSTDDEVRLFLLSSAFGALIHQRGMLPISGSAITAGQEAIVFAGGALGKSTLAASFLGRGYPLLSDDVCAVSFDEAGRPVVHPGVPVVKLWANSLRELGHDPGALRRIRSGLEKYELPVHARFQTKAMPLRNIYILKEATESSFELSRIEGFDRTRAVNRITFRSSFLGGPNPPTRDDLRGEPWTSHLGRVSVVSACCKVAEVTRPSRGFRLEELTDLIERDFMAG